MEHPVGLVDAVDFRKSRDRILAEVDGLEAALRIKAAARPDAADTPKGPRASCRSCPCWNRNEILIANEAAVWASLCRRGEPSDSRPELILR